MLAAELRLRAAERSRTRSFLSKAPKPTYTTSPATDLAMACDEAERVANRASARLSHTVDILTSSAQEMEQRTAIIDLQSKRDAQQHEARLQQAHRRLEAVNAEQAAQLKAVQLAARQQLKLKAAMWADVIASARDATRCDARPMSSPSRTAWVLEAAAAAQYQGTFPSDNQSDSLTPSSVRYAAVLDSLRTASVLYPHDLNAFTKFCYEHELWDAAVGGAAARTLVQVLLCRENTLDGAAVEAACLGLARLCHAGPGAAARRGVAIDAGAFVALAKCLSSHFGKRKVVRAVCLAVERLCEGKSTANRRVWATESGLLPLLIASVRAAEAAAGDACTLSHTRAALRKLSGVTQS